MSALTVPTTLPTTLATLPRPAPLLASQACDEVVAEFLAEMGVHEPPVRGRWLMQRLGLVVLAERERHPRPALWRVAAHLAPGVAARLGQSLHGVRQADGRLWTRMLAERLLAPATWLARDGMLLDWDLAALVERYGCSPVLLARRTLEVSPPATLTVFVDNWLVFRESRPQRVQPLTAQELRCRAQVLVTGRATELSVDGERVQGWPFARRGRSCEVLRTTTLLS